MRTVIRLSLSTLLLFLMACSSFVSKPTKPKKDKNLYVHFQHDSWDKTDPKESDFAWVERNLGDVMIVNSFCDEFQSFTLETLALKTFTNYENFKPLGKNSLMWNGREAFEMEAEAKLDGVTVLFHIRNYRRDHCYYDFLLITPRARSQKSFHAFHKMLAGVTFK
jgi:hypothetical protein